MDNSFRISPEYRDCCLLLYFKISSLNVKEKTMNKDIIQGKWKEIKGKLKQQWSELTDDEIGQMKGSYDELEGTLQKKYGYKKEEAQEEIETFVDKNKW